MDTTRPDPGGAPPAVVRVFGGMGVTVEGEPISIGGVRQRRLLALLAVRAGQVVSVDWLAEHLWTDEERPADPVPSLRTYISRLRGALPERLRDWIATAPAGYQLTAPSEAVEHRRFLQLRSAAAAATRSGDFASALRLLDAALQLWTGDPFRELEDVTATRAEVEQLHVDRLEMLEERWQAALALGRHTQITGELAAFTASHGLRDRAVRQHALALQRSGRTADALAVLAEHRALLVEEAGLDPSPAVLQLEQQLLTGDPALDDAPAGDGRPLRGYRLLEESGRGAFSVVWRGIQPSVDREVAIKQIHAALAAQPDFIRRFEAEAQLVARIEHPYVVPLIDFWRDPDSAYLVMRWMRGGTLERRLDDGPLGVEETLQLADHIGQALSAAHRLGVVHRDVKTANILFDEHGNALLGDFGIATTTDGAGGAAAELSLGTPAYAAPEQIRREPLGPPADVFSLGVILFECLTGTAPFGDLPGPETVDRQLHEPYPLVTELRGDVPSHVAAAIARATAKEVAARFATVQDFVAALATPAPSGAARAVVADHDLPNPYVGLRAFDEGDVERFFGRSRLVDELVGRLRGDGPPSRCVLVVGPSGSGKSSAVRAGLLPAVRNGAVDDSRGWFTATMVPGADPFAALEEALLRVAVDPPADLRRRLRAGRRGILRGVRGCTPDDAAVVLLVIDQFEEVFTNAPGDDADRFLDALVTAVADPQSPLRVVATVRADHFHRPLGHPAFGTLAKQATVHVTPLAGDELELAVVEPAATVGVQFEPGLVARITAAAAGRAGSLPLLQYALAELFDRRDGRTLTIAAYDEIGGLTGALAARAEQLYLTAVDEVRAATRRLFGRLTSPGADTTDLRRRVRLADLGDDVPTATALERYAAARLLTFDHEPASREPTVEVAHEALLREWPRLVAWLDEDHEVLRTAAAIAAAADAWDAEGRQATDLYRGGRLEEADALATATPDRLRPVDRAFVEASRETELATRDREAGRVRRLRRLVAGTATALALALVAGGVAAVQQRRAQDAADDAIAAAEAADLATLISRSAALIGEEDDVAVLLALEAHRRAPGPTTEAAVVDALANSSVGGRVASQELPAPLGAACRGQGQGGPGNRAGPRDQTLTAVADGELVRLDLATGATSTFGTPPAPCVAWGANATDTLWWAFEEETQRFWSGTFGEGWEDPIVLPERTFPVGQPLLGDDRLLLVEATPDGAFLVADAVTGERIGEELDLGFPFDLSVVDGDVAVVGSYHRADDPDGLGLLVRFDAVTGEEQWRRVLPVTATAVDVDEAAGQVVAATDSGSLVTVDLTTGAILHEVEIGTDGIRYVRAMDDDLVISTTLAEIIELDRTSGPTGRRLAIDDGSGPFVDPTGLVHNRAFSRVDTYDLDTTALATTTLDVPTGRVAFTDGRAAVADESSPEVHVIDLDTGGTTTEQLRLPDGTGVRPFEVRAFEDGSLWATVATAGDITLARWIDGTFVDSIELHAGPFAEWHGTSFNGRDLVSHVLRHDGSVEVAVATTSGTAPGVRYRVDIEEDVADFVLADLSLLSVAVEDATLRRHDPTGRLVEEYETGIAGGTSGAWDPVDGLLAITPDIGQAGVVVLDPGTRTQDRLSVPPGTSEVVWLEDGARLAIGTSDGSLQLWDVAEDRPLGQLYRGSGPVQRSLHVDRAARTIWLTVPGRLLEFPTDPERWIQRACEVVSRDLTQAEWDRWVPGGGRVIPACGAAG